MILQEIKDEIRMLDHATLVDFTISLAEDFNEIRGLLDTHFTPEDRDVVSVVKRLVSPGFSAWVAEIERRPEKNVSHIIASMIAVGRNEQECKANALAEITKYYCLQFDPDAGWNNLEEFLHDHPEWSVCVQEYGG